MARRLGRDGIVEEAGFHRPSAPDTARGGGHFLDVALIYTVGGRKAGLVLVKQRVKSRAGFAGHDDTLCKQAVANGVLGRAGLAARSARSTRTRAVGPRGANTAI
jgi:hypothetical protein